MYALKINHGLPISFGGRLTSNTKGHNLSSVSGRAAVTSDAGRSTKNLYKVLSIESENVGMDEIKKAYRSMARRYHPDVCAPSRKEESTRMFVELHRAYKTLSDPVLRRKYDSELRVGELNGADGQFSRETWEAQLSELRRRSDRREKVASERLRI